MPYLQIDDFAAGIDLRKSAITAPAGTLRILKNATITAGGEIEKRKTATSVGALTAGKTHGLAFRGGNLVVFGTLPPADAGALPAYVEYIRLNVADSETIVRVMDTQTYGASIYVVAKFTDGSVRHFYDGVLIPASQVVGTNVRAHQKKMYAIDDVNLRFSAINNPADWDGTGSGVIDVTTEDAPSTELVGIERYYTQLALFCRTSIQMWQMDPDPLRNSQVQVLGNIGLIAPNAVAPYGSGDVLFLSDTGIRSLRARDSSSAAVLNDIGSPVDNLVAARRRIMTPGVEATLKALVDPLSGHFWLVWGSEVIVLALYPQSKVSAWSLLDFNTRIDHIVTANSRVAFRTGDELFIYGSVPQSGNPFAANASVGVTASEYDATSVEVVTPFMDANRPAQSKNWSALDVSCTGTWDVFVNPDYNAPGAWTQIATVTRPTWGEFRLPIQMEATHLAVRMVSRGTGPASVATMALHHDLGEEE